MANFRIVVQKEHLRFSAGHFLVLGDNCERLHGHNYAVSVEISGSLDDKGYVFDFVALKKICGAICDALDHKTIIPGENELLEIDESETSVEVLFRGKKFVFPADDVLVLPLKNSTVELMARYIWELLSEALLEMRGTGIERLEVGVEESPGQAAFYSAKV